jgi:hypothetical protein
MTEPKDPERLLAEALRAQAVFAPQPDRPVNTSAPGTSEVATVGGSGTESLPPQYGLISGAGAGSLERERAALDPVPAASPETPAVRRPSAGQPGHSAPLPVHWILLLAVLLGLAAGSVVGLLTLV